MIEESIRAVKEAESRADGIVADARKEAERIAAEAQDSVRLIREEAQTHLKEAVSARLAEAGAEADKIRAAAEAASAEEVLGIRKDAEAKADEAAKAVMQLLL